MNEIQSRGRFDVGQFSAGVVLLALGVMFLFDRFDILEGVRFGELWPVLLIYFGLVRLVWPPKDHSRRAGAWLVMVGTLLLLHTLRVVRLHDSWPMFIVLMGVLIMWQAFESRDAGRQGEDR